MDHPGRLCSAALLTLGLAACQPDDDDPGTHRPATSTPTETTTTTTTTLTTTETTSGPLSFTRELVLEPNGWIPSTANIRRVELGIAGPAEILVSEANSSILTLLSDCDTGCVATNIPLEIGTIPVRTATADFDDDGDQDIVLSDIGFLWPTTDLVGQIQLLYNDGGVFTTEVIYTGVGRICCAEPGDLDGDGDLDLAVCVFGHLQGSLGWLERDGVSWTPHQLDPVPGAIHAFPEDIDLDGDLDLVAVISQEDEQVAVYRNDGAGGFSKEMVFDSSDTFYGMSGLEPVDLDQDGDVDLVVTHGDTLDLDLPVQLSPEMYYGLLWFENDGSGAFTKHEIADAWGAYSAKVSDMDLDGDLDIVLAALQGPEMWPTVPLRPLRWYENDGSQGFSVHDIVVSPEQLITLEIADVDGDGDTDILAGSMEINATGDTERLTVLRNQIIE